MASSQVAEGASPDEVEREIKESLGLLEGHPKGELITLPGVELKSFRSATTRPKCAAAIKKPATDREVNIQPLPVSNDTQVNSTAWLKKTLGRLQMVLWLIFVG
jgi:hypothetical protein